ncbi:MAG: hydrogen gas-evolving membrane-bound hydrogenase subunit E [Actinomycetota bacterium]
MTATLITHTLIGAFLVLLGDRVGRRGFLVAALAPLVTLIWIGANASSIIDGDVASWSYDWIPQLGLTVDLRVDALSLVMLLLIAGIGLLVCSYSYRYFSASKPALGRLSGLLTLFAGSMTGLVISDHLLSLFVFWELTSVTSYLLIGNDDRNPRARDAATSAILITGSGGLVLLAGFALLGQQLGTYRISEIVTSAPVGSVSWVAVVLVLIGAFTKSAQFPFSGWLPGAMVAPTPISTYLHAATMVKAGVYLVARLSPALGDVSVWRPIVFIVGSITMVFGGWRALRQVDLKLLLAHGTVSQLGSMMIVVGTGHYSMAQAGIVLLLAHGVFKAALFMVVGIVDHQTGTRDVRRLTRLGPGWRPIEVTTVLAAASMAGVPPLLGFIAKEKILAGTIDGSFAGAQTLTIVIVLGSILTFAYSGRFVLGVFGRLASDEAGESVPPSRPPLMALSAPAILLGILALVTGVVPQVIDSLVRAATRALHPTSLPKEVELWAGFNTALYVSVGVIAVGSLLVAGRHSVARLQQRVHRVIEPLPSGDSVFWWIVAGVLRMAKRTTRIIQSGSLPVYVMVILGVSIVGIALPAVGSFDSFPDWIDSSTQVAPLSFIVIAAIGATRVKRRIAAALLLGAVGYGMAGLYVLTGAPDLALTQFAIETLATVLFVLVLRVLPRDFESDRRSATQRSLTSWFRLLTSAAVGVGIFVFALVAAEARESVPAVSVSEEMLERSVPDAYGSNVVNVILVDFRGMDTLGEITVLAVAALGVVALARSAGRRRAPENSHLDTVLRSQVVDTITRLLFASIAILATYFLFAGHNQPGGGFVGGLMVAAAISLRYVAGGAEAVRRSVRVPANVVLGGGLSISIATAFIPLVLGGSVLEHAVFTWDAPILGTIKTTSALFFDTGVFLVVIGLVLMAIEAFGEEPESDENKSDSQSPLEETA